MKTEITFDGYSSMTAPADATDVVFQQRNHGGYLLQYNQKESRNPGSIIIASEQVRNIETKIFFDNEGSEEVRCVVTSDWESQKPSVDAELFRIGKR